LRSPTLTLKPMSVLRSPTLTLKPMSVLRSPTLTLKPILPGGHVDAIKVTSQEESYKARVRLMAIKPGAGA